jgi:hypothetical protein
LFSSRQLLAAADSGDLAAVRRLVGVDKVNLNCKNEASKVFLMFAFTRCSF